MTISDPRPYWPYWFCYQAGQPQRSPGYFAGMPSPGNLSVLANDYVYSNGIHSAVFESLAVRQVWRINGDGCRAFLLSCRCQEIS